MEHLQPKFTTVPKLKEFQRANRNAKIVYDSLIVDGQPYNPDPHGEPHRRQDNTSDTHEWSSINSSRITFINVCGLKSKLLNPNFCDIIKEYNIVGFLESKLDQYDVLNVPNGYDYIMKKNRKNVKRKSGGIVLLYKKHLSRYIHFTNSDFTLRNIYSYKTLDDNDIPLISDHYI